MGNMAKRQTMNVSLPPELKAWVDQQVGAGQYGTASEYIRHLLREALVTNSREAVEASLREAVGPARPLTPARWKSMTQRARRRLADVQRELKSQRRRSA
jgi:antitoxin ParD1/3/4